jgi:hypothetical protein
MYFLELSLPGLVQTIVLFKTRTNTFGLAYVRHHRFSTVSVSAFAFNLKSNGITQTSVCTENKCFSQQIRDALDAFIHTVCSRNVNMSVLCNV